MNCSQFALIPLALLASVQLAVAAGPEKTAAPPPETFLTVNSAGRDYADQGEYLNDWGGAQLIALGGDQFRLVTYKGGLPGAGWDKETKTKVEGKRVGDTIVCQGPDGFKAEIAAGKITIHTAGGGPYTMNKTVRTSPTLGAKPVGGVVLFDIGHGTDEWINAHLDDRGWLAAGSSTKRKFQNYTLHCEFFLPFKPLGRGQDRGNSGVYMQDRYEVQVLDSFGLNGENNECGGIYSQTRPSVNLCFPPLVWQTYDIDFTAAKFDGAGKKTKNAVITVKHNGVIIHDQVEISGPTGGGKPETAEPGAIQLQGHGNPVYYRNVWIVEK